MLSPIASREIGGRFSVGRVQSPAVRLVVEREREIQSFKPVPYYVLSVILEKSDVTFTAFYEKQRIEDRNLAEKIYKEITEETEATVVEIQKKQIKQSPKPPFTTSVTATDSKRPVEIFPRKNYAPCAGFI
ncbi:MAG: DNA topoisomerase [Persephonella sp.]|nr:DNA topoisomerase [Persephonella sp.]